MFDKLPIHIDSGENYHMIEKFEFEVMPVAFQTLIHSFTNNQYCS